MLTFSQLVDAIVTETKRPDRLADFVSFLNQAIREVHAEPSRGNALFYADNYREVLLRASTDPVFMWEIPDPTTFQGPQAAKFLSQWRDGANPYATWLQPGPRFDSEPHVAHRAGRHILFKGYGGLNGDIALSYYAYPRALKYFPIASRPASYDLAMGWTYAAEYDVDEYTRAAAQELTTNWLIQRWHTVLEEGLRAKVYKSLSDETRQRTAYSLYMQLRQNLATAEEAVPGGLY